MFPGKHCFHQLPLHRELKIWNQMNQSTGSILLLYLLGGTGDTTSSLWGPVSSLAGIFWFSGFGGFFSLNPFSDLINVLEFWLRAESSGWCCPGPCGAEPHCCRSPALMCPPSSASPGSTCTSLSVGGRMSALQPWKQLSEKQLVHRCVF